MTHKHSRLTPDGRHVWYAERLWQLARHLPVKSVAIESIAEFDLNCWFDESRPPTCRAVAAHARRIYEADLSHPIILSAKGNLMDGGHRIAKAWLLGVREIAAVQFEVDPEPDEVRSE
ncbi:MAG TPA: hypothetical protein VNA19_16620 [Pyrinomonadaceae bacterium]|nr:hypothetical protein [Pyrinomonadaceae bacterium]